ncbi:DUF2382 domain-containing protein [Nocardia sp. NPDC049190]|uniref:DUF2382 domain-containing protein n=1 Tax=Nocardia sp. NPDC049190 TaxID=3155650 RepID=UPI0033F22128
MTEMLDTLIGSAVYDPDGDKIGKVKRVYIDNDSGSPTWVAVSTGLLREDSLVPLAGARHRRDVGALQVQVEKAAVKSAPHLERDGLISPEAEQQLFDHYKIDPDRPGWYADEQQPHQAADQHPDTDMMRSQARLEFGAEQETIGSARMRDHMVSEDETVPVLIAPEHVRNERAPIADRAGIAPSGEHGADRTPHEDRMRVDRESVPVERVRFAVDEAADNRTIPDTVRTQHIGIDEPEHSRTIPDAVRTQRIGIDGVEDPDRPPR